MARGDHLQASRTSPAPYHHDGIDLGDGNVVHFAADPGGPKSTARVRIDPWAVFAGEGTVTIRPYSEHVDPAVTVARALSQLGRGDYHLVFNNCQHFASWCVTGNHVSEQVEAATATVGGVSIPVAAAYISADLIGSLGLVSGVGGSGIMSGLAASGAVVGGGAVAGVVVLGSGPGAVAVLVMWRAFRHDAALPADERAGRTAGRVGAVVGGVGGAACAVGAISTAGTVAGLSAAGISSGLAAIGSAFGGGMLAGAMATVAAPALCAALGALVFYKLVRWLARPVAAPTPSSPNLLPPWTGTLPLADGSD